MTGGFGHVTFGLERQYSEKQGRRDSAMSLCGTCDETPAPRTGDPRALLVLPLHISPATFEPQGLFSVFFVVWCFLCLHACPCRIPALAAEVILPACSSRSSCQV